VKTVGLTEMHGIAKECAKHPPKGLRYEPIKSVKSWKNHIFQSSALGVLDYFESERHDFIEAPLFPILTTNKWIYTPANFETAIGFNLLGLPTPRSIRKKAFEHIILKKNCLKLLFKSQAGLKTMLDNGLDSPSLVAKSGVLHPAIGRVDDHKVHFNSEIINILFVGEFFRKGGAHAVDAFIDLANEFSNIHLRICSESSLHTRNEKLRIHYLNKIHQHERITIGAVDREVLLNRILPKSDIYLCPTYFETWGFSIQEAMAYGIPVIATEHFAIPEMITNEQDGFLIPTEQFKFIRENKGYGVEHIPETFSNYLTSEVSKKLKLLINDFDLRKRIGTNALNRMRKDFSFEKRNKQLAKIYNLNGS